MITVSLMGFYSLKSQLPLVSKKLVVQMLQLRRLILREISRKQFVSFAAESTTANFQTVNSKRNPLEVIYTNLPYKSKTHFSTMGDTQKCLLDKAKKLAAHKAVDEHVKDGQVLGIGSGTTAVYAVERIAQRVRDEKLNLVCIPTSFQAKNLIISNGLQLSELDVHYPIDVTIDGCDECDQELNIIKGGGGCLLQEKIVASASNKLIIVADYTKESQYLGEKWKKGIPLEVAQLGSRVVLDKLQKFTNSVGGTILPTKVRQAVSKMGPVITDNGNFVVDFQFGDALKTGEIHSAQSIDSWLKTIPGILETGLFVRMANQAYFGQADGTVHTTKERVYKNGI